MSLDQKVNKGNFITKVIVILKKIYQEFHRAWRAGVLHIGFSNIITRFAALAQRILLARILGAENIGHIAVINSALNIIRLPEGVGTYTVVNKLVAESKGDLNAQKEVVGTSIWINSITSVVVVIIGWLILTFTN